MDNYVIKAMPNMWEIVLILVVVLLLFGGKKIPEMMKGLGQGIREFKEGMNPEEPKDQKKESEKPKDDSDTKKLF